MRDQAHILRLDREVRREALLRAADLSGKTAQVLEKDVWVVWALSVLFDGPLRDALAFKGGTSLSKAYGLIDRFSEDVDLTYDVRKLMGLPAEATELIPPNKSQAKRLTDKVRKELPDLVKGQILPILIDASQGLPVHPSFDEKQNTVNIYLKYEPVTEKEPYLEPSVMLEFGARSTGEPTELKEITCDAAPHLANVIFPSATVRVMRFVRTFWEKATLIHDYCCGGRKSDRLSRHWYDLVRLFGRHPEFCNDEAIARQVVEHKSAFFHRGYVNYHDVLEGRLRLVPDAPAEASLRDDFNRMCDGGFFFGTSPEYSEVVSACREIEDRINRKMKESSR